MAILHGSWLVRERRLFLWGETWRRLTDKTETAGDATSDAVDAVGEVPPHPFALNADELRSQLSGWIDSSVTGTDARRRLVLPSVSVADRDDRERPLHSASTDAEDSPRRLHPWQVDGLCLEPAQAYTVLQQLPLGQRDRRQSALGDDLRFWQHLLRWTLDLLARRKVLPGLRVLPEGTLEARWQLLLDSPSDGTRLHHFSQRLPDLCRAASDRDSDPDEPAPTPNAVVRDFLSSLADARVRQTLPEPPLSALPPSVKDWIAALYAPDATLNLSLKQAEPLASALNTWTAPVRAALSGENHFRAAFRLQPPESGDSSRDPSGGDGDNWQLQFCLQAADDPSLLVSATTVWNHAVDRLTVGKRTVERPQETLLGGLGLASRLYPTLDRALQTSRPTACQLDAIEAYQFLKSTRWRLQANGLGVVLPPSLEHFDDLSGRIGLAVRAEASANRRRKVGLDGLLEFQWELSLGGKRLSKAEFDRITTLGSPLVEIDGEWVELRVADVKAAQEFFSNRQGELSLSLEDALRIGTGDTQSLGKLPVVDFEASGAVADLLNTLTGKQPLEPLDAPAHFNGTLRPYQARGVGWLAFLERWGLGACLADDMGLGKTIQTIAFLQHLQEREELDAPALLICPTSVLGNWEREVRKFGKSLRAIVHHGAQRDKGRRFQAAAKRADLVITSYALVHRDFKTLAGVSWRVLVLDEAQNVKNPQAKQSQAVRKLEAEFRLALTGTPVENRLSELWSIMDFLNPGYLGTPSFFKRRFEIPVERYGDTDSLDALRSLVQPFLLRRLKTDGDIIQDLPEKQEMTEFCPLAPAQAKRYQDIVEESLAQIESSDGIQRRGLVLGLLTKLKQVCNHPQLLGLKHRKRKDEIFDRLTRDSGKMQRLEALLEEALDNGDRALLFTQFSEWGKVLQPHLEKRLGCSVLFLYGATRKAQREAMVDRFQHDPQGPPILILSLKAGGTGLNLTRANRVFHVDRWWNPAVENQATDRAFRIGQTRNVMVHKFVSTGTLEEKIHALIESKQALAEQVVGSGESWLADMDTDRLRDLLLLDRTAIVEEE